MRTRPDPVALIGWVLLAVVTFAVWYAVVTTITEGL